MTRALNPHPKPMLSLEGHRAALPPPSSLCMRNRRGIWRNFPDVKATPAHSPTLYPVPHSSSLLRWDNRSYLLQGQHPRELPHAGHVRKVEAKQGEERVSLRGKGGRSARRGPAPPGPPSSPARWAVGIGQGLALCSDVCSTSWKGDWSIQQESKQTGWLSCSRSQASICRRGGPSPSIRAPSNLRS